MSAAKALGALLASREASAGIRPGLARMEQALALMGHPERRLRVVHVAGTNGKGSTARMIQAMLTAAGYRAGLFASPAFPPEEGITLDGAPLPPEELLPLTQTLAALPLEEPLTAFELLTAAALCVFAQRADICVLECGMGGREDATNVCPPPLCAVLTPVARDHAAWLGDTVADIAAQKCGILKGAHPAVTAPGQDPAALAALYARAASLGGRVYQPCLGAATEVRHTLDGTRFVYDGAEYTLRLIGAHQVGNALTALTVADRLAAQGFPVDGEARARGLEAASLPGRFEVLRGGDAVRVLDGAHNPHAAAALAATLRAVAPPRPWILLAGMLRDKDAAAALAHLTPLFDGVICTPPDSPRALSGGELAALMPPSPAGAAAVIEDPREAYTAACARAAGGTAVVAGSFYLTRLFTP